MKKEVMLGFLLLCFVSSLHTMLDYIEELLSKSESEFVLSYNPKVDAVVSKVAWLRGMFDQQ